MTEHDIMQQLKRAGHYFVMSVWTQSQMVFLIALKENETELGGYIADTLTIPKGIVQRRFELMKLSFNPVLNIFCETFEISEQCLKDLHTVSNMRDFIAHSFISLGKDYFLYTPSSDRRQAKIQEQMDIRVPESEELAGPDIYKISFRDEIFDHNFAAIERLDKDHFEEIGKRMGLSRNMVR